MDIIARKTNTKPHKSSNHLKYLGIKVCKDCGHSMSIDNSTCYNCGFSEDDMIIHEEVINRKYRKTWNENDIMYLVKAQAPSSYKFNHKYHIMQNGNNLCGQVSSLEMEIISKMDLQSARIFRKNPCNICFQKLQEK